MAASSTFLFCRIGWMKFYSGLMPGDEKLVGGGRYNQRHVGSEVTSFKPARGRVWGYVEPAMSGDASRLALERIVPGTEDAKWVSGVDVIFVARRPRVGGQVVVGWYRNATVRRSAAVSPADRQHSYNLTAAEKDAVLLPPHRRTFEVPHGAGSLGQANVYYPWVEGTKRDAEWIRDVLELVAKYDGPNLLTNKAAEAEEELSRQVDEIRSAAAGQGFPQNPAERRALEQHAMKRAMRYFRRKFAKVEDVSSRASYDLRCSDGRGVLRVEVKGTTGLGDVVILTRGEVAQARQGKAALYVLHSIRLAAGQASGGKERVLRPWDVSAGRLKAISYTYRLT